MHPEHRSIGELAYRLWQARGCPEGTAERDWLDAEKQLKGAQRTIEPRATEPRSATEPRAVEPRAAASRASESRTSNAIDSTLKATFPASDPPNFWTMRATRERRVVGVGRGVKAAGARREGAHGGS